MSTGPRGPKRRIVFSLLSAGFLKNFEAAIVELAGRGHEVKLVIHTGTGLVGADALSARLERDWPTLSVVHEPVPRDGWQDVTITIRSCEDYLQFLDPRYHRAYRLRAKTRTPIAFRRLIKRRPFQTRIGRKALQRALFAADRLLPLSPAVRDFVDAQDADVLVLTPYIGLGTVQPSFMHAAKALGIPTAVCVASWDHLSSKSLMRPMPDLVTVWNETQRTEAITIHDVPAERVIATGAHLFDMWFDWEPRPREELCRAAGLDPSRPYLLYTCFSPFKDSLVESEFIRRWIEQVRASSDPSLAGAGILVRPHPKRLAQWDGVDLSEYDNVAVWPRDGRFVTDEESKANFFDSLHHSAAVVGLNTSAMIEAAIVGRPVHTILVPEYWESQQGTLHFRYLLEVGGGMVRVGNDFDEHLAQLSDSLAQGPEAGVESRRFVEQFVRPHGLDSPAAPRFADAVEALAATPRRRPRALRALDPLSRRLLGPIARRVGARRAELEAERSTRPVDPPADEAREPQVTTP